MKTFPQYFRHSTRNDFWKIESPERGHFLRNMRTAEGGYCYQSSNITEGEISLVLKNEKDDLKPILENEFKIACKEQATRNNQILLKLQS